MTAIVKAAVQPLLWVVYQMHPSDARDCIKPFHEMVLEFRHERFSMRYRIQFGPSAQSGGRTRYHGANAVVVLNKDGKVITTYATSRAGWRRTQ